MPLFYGKVDDGCPAIDKSDEACYVTPYLIYAVTGHEYRAELNMPIGGPGGLNQKKRS
jgi:hypothetical protein